MGKSIKLEWKKFFNNKNLEVFNTNKHKSC